MCQKDKTTLIKGLVGSLFQGGLKKTAKKAEYKIFEELLLKNDIYSFTYVCENDIEGTKPINIEGQKPLKISSAKNNMPEEFHDLPESYPVKYSVILQVDKGCLMGKFGLILTEKNDVINNISKNNKKIRDRVKKMVEDNTTIENISLVSDIHFPYSNVKRYNAAMSLVPYHLRTTNNSRKQGHYTHWLLEDLPKIRFAEQYEKLFGEMPKLIIQPNPPEWMIESLNLVGYRESECVKWKENIAMIDNLIIPRTYFRRNYRSQSDPCPSNINWLSSRMKDNAQDISKPRFKINGGRPAKNILLSRQGMHRRKISNFDKLMDEIIPLGFEPYRIENLCVEEQIKLFSQADIIVGLSQGAFSNMIFANEASIIDIQPPEEKITEWFILANECNLDYFYFNDCEQKGDGWAWSDYKIDVEKLVNVINEASGEE